MPVSPWKEGEKVESLGGGTVWWESKDGSKIVCVTIYHEEFKMLIVLLLRFNREVLKSQVLSTASRMEKSGW